jgi:hypothetical protein
MPEEPYLGRGTVPLKEFLLDFRSNLTDHELRERYELSARGFVSLIRALLAKNIITPDDLSMRKEIAERRDLAKQSEFLKGLYICPQCSHPHPTAFARCPACGADPQESEMDDIYGSHLFEAFDSNESYDPITTSGDHFYVEDDLAASDVHAKRIHGHKSAENSGEELYELVPESPLEDADTEPIPFLPELRGATSGSEDADETVLVMDEPLEELTRLIAPEQEEDAYEAEILDEEPDDILVFDDEEPEAKTQLMPTIETADDFPPTQLLSAMPEERKEKTRSFVKSLISKLRKQ